MKTITKDDLRVELKRCLQQYDAPVSNKNSIFLLTTLFDILRDQLCQGKRLVLTNYGTIYSAVKLGGRPVRNPRTREPHVMTDTVSIRYRKTTHKKRVNADAPSFITSELIAAMKAPLKAIGLPAPLARIIINQVFLPQLQRTMSGDCKLTIRTFGTFTSSYHRPHYGRNPGKNEPIFIDGHYLPAFKPSKQLIQQAKSRLLK